jgi:hypothetical protein
MKKTLSALSLVCLLTSAIFVSCEKSKSTISPQAVNQNNSSSNLGTDQQMMSSQCSASDGKGGPSKNCTGGDCGICLGFCVKRVKKVENPTDPFSRTQPDYNDYENYVDIYLLNDSTMLLVPYQSFDNGQSYNGVSASGPSGTVNITEDIILPSETAQQLNLTGITIKSGIYNIDFSCNNPYGTITVPVEITN